MGKKIVLSILVLLFLVLSTVMNVSAQTRTVGVNVGNLFRYSVSISWSSNDPNAKPDPSVVNENATQWLQFAVTAISGTNITARLTTHFKNETETTTNGWEDVNTGDYQILAGLFISVNLKPGDSLYNSSTYNRAFINETISRTYSSGVRDTDQFNAITTSGTLNYSSNYYWDKLTGVMVESQAETVNQTGKYTTTSSSDVQIISSDLWTVPEFPNWTATLVILILLTPTVLVLSKRRPVKHRSKTTLSALSLHGPSNSTTALDKEKVRSCDPSFPPHPSFIGTFGILTPDFEQNASSKPAFQNLRLSLMNLLSTKTRPRYVSCTP